jgi:chromosome segregation ATPase
MAGEVKEAERERKSLEEQLQQLKQRISTLGDRERERDEAQARAEEAQRALEEGRQHDQKLAGEREQRLCDMVLELQQELQSKDAALAAKEKELRRVEMHLQEVRDCGLEVREEAERARARAELEAEQAQKEMVMLSQELVDQAQKLCSCESELELHKKAKADRQAQVLDLQRQTADMQQAFEAEVRMRKEVEATMKQEEQQHNAAKELHSKTVLQLAHAVQQLERRDADVSQLQAAVEISEQHFEQVREEHSSDVSRLSAALLAAEQQLGELHSLMRERTAAFQEVASMRMQLEAADGALLDKEAQVERHKQKVQRLIEHLAQAQETSAQEVVRLEDQIEGHKSELDETQAQMETERRQSQDTISQLQATIASLEAEIDNARTQTRTHSDQVRRCEKELEELQLQLGDRKALEDAAGARDEEDRERASARHERECAALAEVEMLRLDVCSLRQELVQSQQRAMQGVRTTVLRVHAAAAAHVGEVETELGRRVGDIGRLDQIVMTLHQEMVGICGVVARAVMELEDVCTCMSDDAAQAELASSRVLVAEAAQACLRRQVEQLSSQMADMEAKNKDIEASFSAVLEGSKLQFELELLRLQQVFSFFLSCVFFSACSCLCNLVWTCLSGHIRASLC